VRPGDSAGTTSSSGGDTNAAGGLLVGGAGTTGIITNQGGTTSDGDAGDTTQCQTGTADASRLPVYLQFVLDGSGSMNGPGSWVAARDALKDIFTDMKTSGDKGIGAGLIVFMDLNDPNLNSGQDPVYPSSADVPVDFVSDAQLQKLVARTAPPDAGKSNTPTGLALTGAYASLTKFQATPSLAAGGKKVVVLITDGAPTDQTCKTADKGPTADYSQNGCIKMAATELAAGAATGIETFVIGVGPLMLTNTYDPYFLGALAVSGGSAPKGCDPKSTSASSLCFFSIDPTANSDIKQAFMTAINDIRGTVATCSLQLKPATGTIDPTKVRVTLNGMPVYQDAVDGWSYDDPTNPTHVTLNGKSCEALKSNPASSINVILGCAVEMPPVK
jgi:uncharacterized protein YegL